MLGFVSLYVEVWLSGLVELMTFPNCDYFLDGAEGEVFCLDRVDRCRTNDELGCNRYS